MLTILIMVIARWLIISSKFGQALGHTIDHRLHIGIACVYICLSVFPMWQPYKSACLKKWLWRHVLCEVMGVPIVRIAMSGCPCVCQMLREWVFGDYLAWTWLNIWLYKLSDLIYAVSCTTWLLIIICSQWILFSHVIVGVIEHDVCNVWIDDNRVTFACVHIYRWVYLIYKRSSMVDHPSSCQHVYRYSRSLCTIIVAL